MAGPQTASPLMLSHSIGFSGKYPLLTEIPFDQETLDHLASWISQVRIQAELPPTTLAYESLVFASNAEILRRYHQGTAGGCETRSFRRQKERVCSLLLRNGPECFFPVVSQFLTGGRPVGALKIT